jgi:3-keto-5-aminohexanoate cleavage enzyme
VNKLIIEVRVNEYAMRDRNPKVPWTAEEIGRDAREIEEAGASVVHFHARRADGSPAHEIADYAAAIRAIRANSDLLINPTLGQITKGGTLERIAHLEAFAGDPILLPEIVGLDPGSTNIDVFDAGAGRFATDDKVYVNAHSTLLAFTARFRELGIKAALACWGIPFLRSAGALMDLQRVDEPAYVLLVHGGEGQLGAHPATPEGLRAFTDHLPRGRRVEWAVCCKGGNLFPLAMAAIAAGGHVAIGIGDHPYDELGAPSNADLVREVVNLARLIGRPVATPAQTREMLGVPARR